MNRLVQINELKAKARTPRLIVGFRLITEVKQRRRPQNLCLSRAPQGAAVPDTLVARGPLPTPGQRAVRLLRAAAGGAPAPGSTTRIIRVRAPQPAQDSSAPHHWVAELTRRGSPACTEGGYPGYLSAKIDCTRARAARHRRDLKVPRRWNIAKSVTRPGSIVSEK